MKYFELSEKNLILFWILYPVFFCLTACSVLGGCSYLNQKAGIDDDNIFEEVVEEIIEQKTGLDVDLTPDSIE